MRKILLISIAALFVLTACNFEFLSVDRNKTCEVPLSNGEVKEYVIPDKVPCPMELAEDPNLAIAMPLPAGFCWCYGFIIEIEADNDLYIFVIDSQGDLKGLLWYEYEEDKGLKDPSTVKHYWIYKKLGEPEKVSQNEAAQFLNEFCGVMIEEMEE